MAREWFGLRNGRAIVCAIVLLAAVGTAVGQFGSDFEAPAYGASAGGTILTGQDGWYVPTAGTASTDWFAYTYAGNTLGIAPHPGGGAQFAGMNGPGNSSGATTYGRAQRDVPIGGGEWSLSGDVAVAFLGTLPTAQNIGSLSTQPGGASARTIMLATWTDVQTASTWDFQLYAATSTAPIAARPIPDPGFQNLLVNHWYRYSTTFDFATNRILEVSIEDLTSGQTATHLPPDWWLEGGPNGTLPRPTAIRLFAGTGTVEGNTMAFDNVTIEPAGGCVGDLDGDGDTDLADLGILLADFGCTPPGPCPGDLDNDGDTDLADLGILLADFGCTP